ncbi:anaerobic ribonucleoside-triphosphate reductase activating protein [Candidatus Micrarchaeota archaeon]|nr:anaerobic ribonucleoside-triphosphate reductase activating protein [Candidatus Micrarchaeota archaeon]
MEFAYIQKTSLVDYPGNICSTVFTIGCNFKCPFCYNKSLVLPEEFPRNPLTEEQVLSTLIKRKKFVSAVCITGGEPTMYDELYNFIKSLKNEGFLVKLDTNGTNPKIIKKLIENKLVDYIAMDIKNSFENYTLTTGVDTNTDNIQETIKILKNSDLEYELRITIVPSIHKIEDIEKIGMVSGGNNFSIQIFKRTNTLIDSSLVNVAPFSQNELSMFKKTAEKYFSKVELKG